MSASVTLVDVSPRDGLQNEAAFVSTADKVALVDLLSAAGLRRIEAASFVSARRVPQMADGAAVLAGLCRWAGVRYGALVPHLRGYEAARAAGVDEVAVFASATERFSQANLGCSIAESLERFAPVLDAARANGVPVRGYVSCVTDCPFEGPVAPAAVADLARRLAEAGCAEIALGDTIGAATPATTHALLRAVTAEVPPARLAGHFHDTRGRALDNIDVALGLGLRVFDVCVAGLGGCPFAPGAAGNVDAERTVAHLRGLGFETGIDDDALARAAALARRLTRPGAAA